MSAARVLLYSVSAIFLIIFYGCKQEEKTPQKPSGIESLADAYIQLHFVKYHPEKGTIKVIPGADHASLGIPTAENRAQEEKAEDSLLRELQQLDPSSMSEDQQTIFYTLKEKLESDIQLRTCNPWSWSFNPLEGALNTLEQLAKTQPVHNPELQKATLERWGLIPSFIRCEISNNKKGLAMGYSVPQPVIRNLAVILDKHLTTPVNESFLNQPGKRSNDKDFQAALDAVVRDSIYPAIQMLKTFLEKEYLPQARTTLAIRDLPDGASCYTALVRAHTSIELSDTGLRNIDKAITQHMDTMVVKQGSEYYNAMAPEKIRSLYFNDKNNFLGPNTSIEKLISEYDTIMRNRVSMFVADNPKIPMTYKWVPAHKEAMESEAYYTSAKSRNDTGVITVNRAYFKENLKGVLPSILFHEGIPGHHLQHSFRVANTQLHPLNDLLYFGGFVEGWATYASEAVVDLGWYPDPRSAMVESLFSLKELVTMNNMFQLSNPDTDIFADFKERYTMDSTQTLKWMTYAATLPAYQNAYGVGYYVIYNLRKKAERILEDRFSLREFHYQCLRHGNIPLNVLQRKIEQWIAKNEAIPR